MIGGFAVSAAIAALAGIPLNRAALRSFAQFAMSMSVVLLLAMCAASLQGERISADGLSVAHSTSAERSSVLEVTRSGRLMWQRELGFELAAFEVSNSGALAGIRETQHKGASSYYVWGFDSTGAPRFDERVLTIQSVDTRFLCGLSSAFAPDSRFMGIEVHDSLGVVVLRHDAVLSPEDCGTSAQDSPKVEHHRGWPRRRDELWRVFSLETTCTASPWYVLARLDLESPLPTGFRGWFLESQPVPGTSCYVIRSLAWSLPGVSIGEVCDVVRADGRHVATFWSAANEPLTEPREFSRGQVDELERFVADELGPFLVTSFRRFTLRTAAGAPSRTFDVVPSFDPCSHETLWELLPMPSRTPR